MLYYYIIIGLARENLLEFARVQAGESHGTGPGSPIQISGGGLESWFILMLKMKLNSFI
jgi:hypothetical protein